MKSWDILHVVEPRNGGAPAVAAQLATWEHEAGFRVALVGHPESRAVVSGATAFETIASDLSLGTNLPRSYRALAPLMERARVIHLHSSRAGLIGRLVRLRNGQRIVFTPHGWSWHVAPQRLSPLFIAVERALARKVDVLHVLSRAEVAEAEEHLGVRDARVALIPNGVDLARFTVPRRSPSGTRGPLRMLVVGRLCVQKGQDLLLDALEALPCEQPIHLTLVGEGPAGASLRSRIPRLPNHLTVEMTGPVDDPAGYYQRADLAVFPSRWEGQSLALLEAVATGCPVLATDVSGTEDLADCIATCRPTVRGLGAALQTLVTSQDARDVLAAAAIANRERVGIAGVREEHLALKRRLLDAA